MKLRWLSLLTAALLVSGMSAGCERRTGATLEVDLTQSYVAEPVDMNGIRVDPIVVTPKGVVMEYYHKYYDVRMYLYHPEDGSYEQFEKEQQNESVCAATLPDGRLCAIYNVATDRKRGTNVYDGKQRVMEIYNDDLTLAESIPFPDSVPEGILMGQMRMDGEGNWFVFLTDEEGSQTLCVLDDDLAFKGTIDMDSYWCETVVTGASGDVYALMGGGNLYRLDAQAMTAQPVEGMLPEGVHALMDGNEYELYYSADGIYGVSAEGETQLLVDYVNSDLFGDVFRSYTLPDGTFLIGYFSPDTGYTSSYYRLRPRTQEESQGVQYITLAGVDLAPALLQDVCRFNHEQSDYRIFVKDYARGAKISTWDTGESVPGSGLSMEQRYGMSGKNYYITQETYDALTDDLLAGTVPDILCMDGLPVQQLANKGLLTDLWPMLEEEERFDESAYFMNILDGLKYKGQLHQIGFSFLIETACAKTEFVGEQEGRTPAEYLTMLESVPEGMEILPAASREDLEYSFLLGGQGAYIDRDTMTCHFDDGSFAGLLTLIGSLKTAEERYASQQDYWDQLEWAYGEDHTLLSRMTIDKPIVYHDMKAGIFRRADVTFVGFPDPNGNGGRYRMNYTIALTSRSDQTEGVWEFIMQELSSQQQSRMCQDSFRDNNSLPLMREPFGNALKAATVGVHPGSGNASEEEMEALLAYTEGLTQWEQVDTAVTAIIAEEAERYFAGDTTADAAAAQIQSRVSLYLSEQG